MKATIKNLWAFLARPLVFRPAINQATIAGLFVGTPDKPLDLHCAEVKNLPPELFKGWRPLCIPLEQLRRDARYLAKIKNSAIVYGTSFPTLPKSVRNRRAQQREAQAGRRLFA